MIKSRLSRFLATCIPMLVCLGGIVTNQVPALAQDPEPSPTPAPKLTLECRYPAVAADVGESFSFDIYIKYYGTERQTFNLVATAPSGWSSSVIGTGFKQITQVQLAAYDVYTPGIEDFTVNFTPSYLQLPGPGVYGGTIKVTNGTLTETMELRATVISRYNFALYWTDPTTGYTTTDVTMRGSPGEVSDFPFELINAGSAEIKDLTFSAETPKGWSVIFNPTSLVSLGSNQTQQVDALFTPPEGSNMAGDYVIFLKGDNGSVAARMTLRIYIPVASTSVWLVVGIAASVIAVLVIAYQLLGKKKAKIVK